MSASLHLPLLSRFIAQQTALMPSNPAWLQKTSTCLCCRCHKSFLTYFLNLLTLVLTRLPFLHNEAFWLTHNYGPCALRSMAFCIQYSQAFGLQGVLPASCCCMDSASTVEQIPLCLLASYPTRLVPNTHNRDGSPRDSRRDHNIAKRRIPQLQSLEHPRVYWHLRKFTFYETEQLLE